MINEAILVVAVSIDTFIMAISCGMDCIKIPFKSALGVGVVGSVMMILSVLLSDIFCNYIPYRFCNILCCVVLCIMGSMNIVKHILEKYKKFKSLQVESTEKPSIIDVYLCGSCADCDKSKEVSVKEAVIVSFFMSIDTVATGLVGGSSLNILFLGISVLLVQTFTVWLGSILGRKSTKFPDISLLGGILLIILGIFKIV